MGKVAGLDDYEIEAWITRLGSMPVERVLHKDMGESYQRCEAHVLELENKKYALVSEVGCSCYDSRSADIDLFENMSKAEDAFNRWIKEHTY